MDGTLAALGLAKLFFGLLVGVVGITIAARIATRLAGFASVDEGLRAGNVAVGIVVGGSVLAMAILVRHAVDGTFVALDLLQHADPGLANLGWVAIYAAVHLAAALGAGAGLLVLGTRIFVRLTPEVDEVAEIHAGNLASALVLASLLVALALLAQEGVDTMLDGLMPLPTLGRSGLVTPS